MKTSLSHLPASKQEELERVTKLIVETADPEKVILYGSYATGEWQEDRYAEKHIVYSFDSDYDILVITKAGDKRKDYEITSQITNRSRYRVPINVITHDITYINEQLEIGQYFFSEIIRQGILLFDSGISSFVEPRQLTKAEKKNIAEQDFRKWYDSAVEFLASVNFSFERNQYKIAAFILHQAAERTYSAVMLVFCGYKPKTHNLDKLRNYTKAFSEEFNSIFPLNSKEEEHLFSLLVKGYIDARYKDDYEISKEELLELMQRVSKMQDIAKEICEAKIESLG